MGRARSTLAICLQCLPLLPLAVLGAAECRAQAAAVTAVQSSAVASVGTTQATAAATQSPPTEATNAPGAARSGVQMGVQLDQPASRNHDTDTILYASPTRKDHIGRIMSPVMVNGKGPFRFIVDTGASYSTVSPQLAQTLGLHTTSAMIKVNGITGTAQASSVLIDRLQAGDIVYKDQEFPIVWAPVMAGADGILGIAGLKSERLLVDFARNRVVISRSMRTRTPFGFVRVPMSRLENGLVMIQAEIGWVRARAIIDTGAERTLGNLALLEALRGARPLGSSDAKSTQVYGSTSEIVPGQLVTAPTISLGKIRISNVEMVYGDFHIFDVWNMRNHPALIIGMDILGSVHALAIDFQEQEIYIEDSMFGVDAREPVKCFGVPTELEGTCNG